MDYSDDVIRALEGGLDSKNRQHRLDCAHALGLLRTRAAHALPQLNVLNEKYRNSSDELAKKM